MTRPENTPWDWTGTPQFEGGAFHCYIVDSTGRKIGTVWGPSEEKIARARLWSVSPELAEALQTLRDYVSDTAVGELVSTTSPDGVQQMAAEDLQWIDDLIARARAAS